MHFDGVVFPGQGTQNLGMGADFVATYKEAREIFDTASDLLNFDVYEICQQNNLKLNNTEYTQPCILTLEIAIFRVLVERFKFHPKYFAGHSLGEYAALVASKVLPFEIAIQMVHARGKLMQSVGDSEKPTGMIAVITDPMPLEQIKIILDKYSVDLANDNSKQQIVLSGYLNDLDSVLDELKNVISPKSMRAVPLEVQAAFHSRHMKIIENDFYDYILQFKEKLNPDNLINVISNYFGNFYPNNNIDILLESLTKQVSGSVKWRDNMHSILNKTQNILEIGPAPPLRGFFKSLGINIQSITNVKSINRVFEHHDISA